ncbi:MAG: hypothetical protein GPJ54_00895 [Candidatus Heimdallarchaeota archaeon]|nr:hypothetical protein [Candidatus Heimdallarchaeota archaeon]
MKLKPKNNAILLIIFMFLFTAFPANNAQSRYSGTALNLEGTHNGAEYKIRVPENWNDILLVYAHGYGQPSSADAAPGGTAMEDFLLSLGYAVAGSRYQSDGWAVKDGLQDTASLTNFFKGKVGNPDNVILWGFSMGSVIAFESAERYSGLYDGVIAGCAVGGGTSRAWDGALQIGLAYDAAFGWPESWGSVGDVRDDIDFGSEVVPVLFGQVTTPGNIGLFEFIRLVNGLPAADFYGGSNWLFTDMFFVTQARGELEGRAGGPVAQNVGITASLTASEMAYLSSLGVDASALLDEMNSNTITAPKNSRNYVKHYADYTGDIKSPVLTIHTTTDGLVPVSNENAYNQLIEAAGKSSMLVQTYTDSVGHCTFSPQQLVSVVFAMQSWLETGVSPSSLFFSEAIGFLNDFTPPEMTI